MIFKIFVPFYLKCSIQAMESQGSLNIKMPSYDVEIAIEKTILSLQWKSFHRKRLSLYIEKGPRIPYDRSREFCPTTNITVNR